LSYGSISIIPKYDFNVTDIVVDYEWNVTDKLSFRPGINYQKATYDDTDYLGESYFGGFLNGSQGIQSIAASLKGEYYLMDNWRMVAALRADKFNAPDDLYVSYQFATTYKLKDKFLFRAVHSRSNSSGFIANAFLNVVVATPGSTALINGNPDLKLVNNTMSEIGFRAQLSSKFQVDLAVFTQKLENLNEIIMVSAVPQPDNSITVTQQFSNLPLKGIQNGFTLSANYVPTNKLQLKPFITVQKTKVQDFPRNSQVSLTDVIEEVDHKSTPTLYGGAFINYLASRKLNLNLNAYYFSQHTLYHAIDRTRPSTIGEINGKILLNSKITFHAIDKLNFYLNVRNILGNDSREHYGTDRIGRSYFLGASYNF
jgi:iron complex outermembrane receptor protein